MSYTMRFLMFFISFRVMRPSVLFATTLAVSTACFAQESEIQINANVPYRPELADDAYAQEFCKLDIYQPAKDVSNAPILIWFHGGGLEGGSKTSGLTKKLAESFAAQGVIVVVPDYRLSPNVTFPTYLEDAARVVSYTQTYIASSQNGADVFVGGHSAGGYIVSLLAMDLHYLKDAGVDETTLAGFIPVSGQVMTHFTVAKEKGIARPAIIADEAAPIYHIRKETAPILVIMGGDDWPARLEENRYYVAVMRKVAENNSIALVEVDDRTHSSILKGLSSPDDPAAIAALSFIRTKKLPPDEIIENN
ncbi:alpha/beta hydrolase [Cerasicoccus arenae]|uniref:alpha/beta hydrolase n=1 Tax=Cerasicoccus arenae TaxID=424488 RepID=UPI00227D8946|nr:alpha/beta hydrolase [Cerasicoccus arenae]